jgi:creatinine deaminase
MAIDIYEIALEEARKGLREDGIPIGAALARGDTLIASGHNQRVQRSDPTAHAEIDCLRSAGRLHAYDALTLFTTLAPCYLCSGAVVLFGIPRVVVGEQQSYDASGSIAFLRAHGVEVKVLEDERARALMVDFIKTKPDLWAEDIGHSSGEAR